MDISIIQDIVIILGLSVLIILLFIKLKIPAILGFLITGILAGPSGLSLINATHEVELMSEIGVIFLLFIIGIEFSIKGLMSIRKIVFLGGFLQVGLTILAVALLGTVVGLKWNEAVFMGFLLSLSSTAIVLKLLQEKGELNSPQGRISMGILIFQDIIVVPMMLFTPLLSGSQADVAMTLVSTFAKFAGLLLLVFLLARYVFPQILSLVVKAKSTELFLLTIVVICFATAWLTSSLGLSVALGAFFAGLIISESPYSHQATANILPFREIFISFFFVSVGMLLDLKFFIRNILEIHLLALVSLTIKGVVISLVVFILRYPLRTVLISGLMLFQVGEFAFLLSATGVGHGLLSPEVYQYFLSVSIISMGLTPFVITRSQRISDYIIKIPLSQKVKRRLDAFVKARMQVSAEMKELADHLVVVGYGINGQNVAKAARNANIPYLIIELDPDIFQKALNEKEPVVFGDAASATILKHARIQHSRVVVIAISDPEATKKIIASVRDFTDGPYIIVRTRYIREIEDNLKLGADEVIPEEFETSIEIFTRVLRKYLIPYGEIEIFINRFRSDNYELFRSSRESLASPGFLLEMPDMQIAILEVKRYESRIVGKTLGESNLRQEFGVNILAIRRKGKYITRVSAEVVIEMNDILYLLGSPEQIAKLNIMLHV
jgi:monovalent cation:H+ antiporter-2, CPA2 family